MVISLSQFDYSCQIGYKFSTRCFHMLIKAGTPRGDHCQINFNFNKKFEKKLTINWTSWWNTWAYLNSKDSRLALGVCKFANVHRNMSHEKTEVSFVNQIFIWKLSKYKQIGWWKILLILISRKLFVFVYHIKQIDKRKETDKKMHAIEC